MTEEHISQDKLNDLAKPKSSFKYSEVEMHAVKTAFGIIEGIWRDMSMGSNHAASSQFVHVHKHLGEIGSELFGKIFLNKKLPAQVASSL